MKDYKDQIQSYLNEEIEVIKKLDINEINKAMNILEETREKGTTIYICGNGGSASTASHFASDFNKGVSEQYEKKYHFICLSDNVASMMAIANDISYKEIFKIPLEGRMKPGDILIVISGSGNSENVVRAAQFAKAHGNMVIGITGYSGGKIKEIADVKLHIPINNMQIAEDLHLFYNHLMMYILTHKEK